MKFNFLPKHEQPQTLAISPESISPQQISPGSILPQPYPPYPYPPTPRPPYYPSQPSYPYYPPYPYPPMPSAPTAGGCLYKWSYVRLANGRSYTIYVTSITNKSIGGFLQDGRQIALDLNEIVEMTC